MCRNTLLLMFLLLASSMGVHGQHIGVKSFRALPFDMDARQNYPLKDQNGEVCAIVKVVTPEKGFYFDIGSLGITKTEQRVGEIWVYVPHGARRISIFHDKLGVVRDYFFTEPIEEGVSYELVLVSGTLHTTVIAPELEAQWVLITTDPADAFIFLDDNFEARGTLQKKLLPGRHTYRVEAPLYHTEAGAFDLDADTKKVVTCKLKPNFGFVEVTSSPETGAALVLNGLETGLTTPVTTGRLPGGQHRVTVVKAQYNPVTQLVTVADGDTARVTLTMSPNYALITLNAPAAAQVYINDVPMGQGSWQGRLSPGVYSVEARLDKHHPDRHDIVVEPDQPRTLTLQPRERWGQLDLTSSPPGAVIKMDGQLRGTTPITLKNLLMGSYAIELTLDGYASSFVNATITEGETTSVNAIMQPGRLVTIHSNPSPAILWIDSVRAGVTPWHGSLPFGSHVIGIEQAGKRTRKRVDMHRTGDGDTTFTVALAPESFTETVNGVTFEMIHLGAGTFLMGSEAGNPDEKPVHLVTVSDFALGKTEVSKALWKAVMGNEPGKFVGDDLPVERVSWNDAMAFVDKLSQLTGKSYRLPTEAEWEYGAGAAASLQAEPMYWAGTRHRDSLGSYAWYSGNSEKKPHPVATKRPNLRGLHDMGGNVWEWCADLYEEYTPGSATNPQGAANGTSRVFRGGSWSDNPEECTIFKRSRGNPHNRYYNLGFRVALSP